MIEIIYLKIEKHVVMRIVDRMMIKIPTLFLTVTISLMPAKAQLSDTPTDVIVIQETSPGPQHSLEYNARLICNDGLYEIAILNKRRDNPKIIALSRNGVHAANRETNKFSKYLERSLNVNIVGLRCYGDKTILVSLSGSYYDTKPDQEDDYITSIIVKF